MAFNMALCWIAAAVVTGVLTAMGIRNWRGGYRRERTDIPADIVSLWAAVAAPETPLPNVVSRDTAERRKPDQIASSLIALGAFARIGQPVLPVPKQESTAPQEASSESTVDPLETRQTR